MQFQIWEDWRWLVISLGLLREFQPLPECQSLQKMLRKEASSCTWNLAGFPYIFCQNALLLHHVRGWTLVVCQLKRCTKSKNNVCSKCGCCFSAVTSGITFPSKYKGILYTAAVWWTEAYSLLRRSVLSCLPDSLYILFISSPESYYKFSHSSFLSVIGSKMTKMLSCLLILLCESFVLVD